MKSLNVQMKTIVFVLVILLNVSDPAFIIEKIYYENAPGVVIISRCKLMNDGFNDSVIDIEFELIVDNHNTRLLFKVFIPDSPADQKFQRQIYGTAIDMQSVLTRLKGNMLSSIFLQRLVESSEFEWKFPLKKGIYQIKNASIPGKLLPKLPLRLMVFVQAFMKVEGRKSAVYGGLWKFYVNLNK